MMKGRASLKAILSAVFGSALQWYDFSLFGYLAPIIALTFFPEQNHFSATIKTFTIFAVGFIVSPIGVAHFANIADKRGRKKALMLSIVLMTAATAFIAILPSYTTIGIVAPILLALLRMMQGFVGGAEFTGSAVFMMEHASPKRRYFLSSLTSSGYTSGLLIGALVASLVTAHFMPSWAWRVAFAFAIMGGGFTFYLRYKVMETPAFTKSKQIKMPLLQAIKTMPKNMLTVAGVAWLVSVLAFGAFVYMATYLHLYAHLSLSLAITMVTVALVVNAVVEPCIAMLADRYGPERIMLTGILLLLIFIIPLFHLILSGSIIYIVIAMASIALLIAIICAPTNAYLTTLFPVEFRCSGYGVAFQLAVTIFGGTAPLLMATLAHSFHNPLAPAYYYVFAGFVGCGAILFCKTKQLHGVILEQS